MSRGERAVRPNRGRFILAVVVYAILFILLADMEVSLGQTQAPMNEYQVKAGFLFHFAQMVEWPAEALGPDTHPIVFCVTGEDAMAAALQAIVPGKQIAAHPIELRKLNDKADFRQCHLLFIGGSDQRRVAPILARLQNAPVLAIGECEGFAQQGGVIELLLQNNKVRFDVNVGAAQHTRLKISSRLLLLARTVIPAGKAG